MKAGETRRERRRRLHHCTAQLPNMKGVGVGARIFGRGLVPSGGTPALTTSASHTRAAQAGKLPRPRQRGAESVAWAPAAVAAYRSAELRFERGELAELVAPEELAVDVEAVQHLRLCVACGRSGRGARSATRRTTRKGRRGVCARSSLPWGVAASRVSAQSPEHAGAGARLCVVVVVVPGACGVVGACACCVGAPAVPLSAPCRTARPPAVGWPRKRAEKAGRGTAMGGGGRNAGAGAARQGAHAKGGGGGGGGGGRDFVPSASALAVSGMVTSTFDQSLALSTCIWQAHEGAGARAAPRRAAPKRAPTFQRTARPRRRGGCPGWLAGWLGPAAKSRGRTHAQRPASVPPVAHRAPLVSSRQAPERGVHTDAARLRASCTAVGSIWGLLGGPSRPSCESALEAMLTPAVEPNDAAIAGAACPTASPRPHCSARPDTACRPERSLPRCASCCSYGYCTRASARVHVTLP